MIYSSICFSSIIGCCLISSRLSHCLLFCQRSCGCTSYCLLFCHPSSGCMSCCLLFFPLVVRPVILSPILWLSVPLLLFCHLTSGFLSHCLLFIPCPDGVLSLFLPVHL